jgi:hypothetical protein
MGRWLVEILGFDLYFLFCPYPVLLNERPFNLGDSTQAKAIRKVCGSGSGRFTESSLISQDWCCRNQDSSKRSPARREGTDGVLPFWFIHQP